MRNKNAAIRSLFISSFSVMLSKSKKEFGYNRLAENIRNAEKDLVSFKESSGYNQLVVNKDNVIATYGEAFYKRARKELDTVAEMKREHIRGLRIKLQKADDKVANIMSKNFNIKVLIDSFGGSMAKDQYDEGLITFGEFANALLDLIMQADKISEAPVKS